MPSNLPSRLAIIVGLLLAVAFVITACTCNNAEDSEDDDTDDDADDDDDSDDDDDTDDEDDTDDDIAEGWHAYTLDTENYTGASTSIALDPNNKVHITYLYSGYDGEIRYITNRNNQWKISAITSSYGGALTNRYLAIDSNGKAHIVYPSSYDDNAKLMYATNSSKGWQIFTLDSLPIGGTGWAPSIALDSNDKIHISYYQCGEFDNEYLCKTPSVKYATNKTGSWQKFAVILDECGEEGCLASIAVDSNGKVHMGYLDVTGDYNTYSYLTNAYGAWTKEVVEEDVAHEGVIAIDHLNKVHFAYIDYGVLNYATNESSLWMNSDIDTGDAYHASSSPSIALDLNDKVHISYEYYNWSEDTSVLRYATNKLGAWEITTIDSSGDAGGFSSIAVDSDNYVHISYYDGENKNLKYATNRPPQ